MVRPLTSGSGQRFLPLLGTAVTTITQSGCGAEIMTRAQAAPFACVGAFLGFGILSSFSNRFRPMGQIVTATAASLLAGLEGLYAGLLLLSGHQAYLDELIAGGLVYGAGVLTLRVTKTIGEVYRSTSKSTNSPPSPEKYPTLEEVLVEGPSGGERYPVIHEALKLLEGKLTKDEPMRQFLGIASDDFPLEKMVGNVRLCERIPTERTGSGAMTKGGYDFEEGVLYFSKDSSPSTIAHELLHALHHRAVKKQLTHAHLIEALELCPDHPEFKDYKSRVSAFVSEGQAIIPKEIREAGAHLLLSAGVLNHLDVIESVATRYELTAGSLSSRLLNWLNHRFGHQYFGRFFIRPIAILGGLGKTQTIRGMMGYCNPKMFKKALAKGPVDAIL